MYHSPTGLYLQCHVLSSGRSLWTHLCTCLSVQTPVSEKLLKGTVGTIWQQAITQCPDLMLCQQ